MFGVRLNVTENKRGYYVKITEQLTKAIINYVTGNNNTREPSVAEIISAVATFPEDDIISFLITWFKFSRSCRSQGVSKQFLIEFRVNDNSKSISQLVQCMPFVLIIVLEGWISCISQVPQHRY